MSNYKPYPKYKKSGVAWLGDVPEGWESIKFKQVLNEKKKKLNLKLNCGSISFGNVIYKDNDKVPVSTKESYQEVLEGEFLVNPLNLNFDLKSLRTALSSLDVVVSTGYIVLQSKSNINKSYLRWLLHQFDVAHMKTLGAGVRQTINYTDIGNSYFYIPSMLEQIQIANYLDQKSKKIDTLIKKQQTLIELLKEKRQALISHAVTKGLDDSVAMKDSGGAWLGDVAKGWEVTKLGYITKKIGSGKTPRGGSEIYSDRGILFIRSQNVYDKGLYLDDAVYISEQIDNDMINTRIKTGDILLNVTGGSIGRSTTIPTNFVRANVNQHVCIIRLNSEKYLHYMSWVMKSLIIKTQIDSIQNGAAREGLNFEQIAGFQIPFPPLKQQTQIANHLNKKTKTIDTLIEKSTKAIDLLKERRVALVSAVVTGKIDVS